MEELKPKHSPIGASSMYRWQACPGSVRLLKGVEQKAGLAALEGTAAHEFVGLALERALSENKPTIEIMNGHLSAMQTYAEFIEGLRAGIESPITHVEHSFDMHMVFPNLYGTADCVVFDPHREILYVIDYKHGKALPVEVFKNKQLSYYALGAIMTLPYRPKIVEMIIVQPRCYHPDGPIRRWRTAVVPYFLDFKADLVEAARETLKENAQLNAGDHCIFCAAKTECPARHNTNLTQAKSEFVKTSPHKFYTDPKKEFEPI